MTTRDDEMAALRAALGITTQTGTISDLRAAYFAKALEGGLPVAPPQHATGDLPDATENEGVVVYDSTTKTLKFSNGTVWKNVAGA